MNVRTVTVVNRLGLHARAATRLVNCASGFEAEIFLTSGEKEVNGKSIMGVLMLAAGRGTELEIKADGSDEDLALEQLAELIENRFGEQE